MQKVLIKNGHVWSAHDDFEGDIYVVDGKIVAMGKNLDSLYSADETIDAKGMYVFPGGIDAHTHMELPFMGTHSSDDFETGTLAGLHGGTTSIIDFAICSDACTFGLASTMNGLKSSLSDLWTTEALRSERASITDEISRMELMNSGASAPRTLISIRSACWSFSDRSSGLSSATIRPSLITKTRLQMALTSGSM